MAKTIYLVTNGQWTDGYYLKKENAEECVRYNNEFVEKYKDLKYADKREWEIEEIRARD